MQSVLQKFDKMKPMYDTVSHALVVTCKLLLIVDILLIALSVVGDRVSFIPGSSWVSGLVVTSMSYVAVLSASVMIRRKRHIRLTAFDRFLPAKLLKMLDLLTDVIIIILGVIFFIEGFIYVVTVHGGDAETLATAATDFWLHFPVPLGGFLMVFYGVEAAVYDMQAFYRTDTVYDLKNHAEQMIKEAKS